MDEWMIPPMEEASGMVATPKRKNVRKTNPVEVEKVVAPYVHSVDKPKKTWTERLKEVGSTGIIGDLSEKFGAANADTPFDPKNPHNEDFIDKMSSNKRKERKNLTGQTTDNVGKFMELDEEDAWTILRNISKDDPELAKKLKREYVTRKMSA